MSVRPSSDWDSYAPQRDPSRLHAVLSAGEAQREAQRKADSEILEVMRRQDALRDNLYRETGRKRKVEPPVLRPQSSHELDHGHGQWDERTWGEWAYEKYDTGKEKVKGAGRYAQDKYNDAASVFAAMKVKRDIKALEDEMRQMELDSPEYNQKAAELMVLRDRLIVLKHGIAARFGLTSIDDEEIVE